MALSIADGASTSFLEALVGGSFPIQTRTACSSEWVIDGESGLLVDPLDVAGVARALRRALTDDHLIDHAGQLNEATVRTRLDWDVIRGQLVAGYQRAHEYGLQTAGEVAG